MLSIKKVSVTPLAENEGKIIDSLNTSDNQEFNFYEMWTKDGYYFKFGCKPYIKTLRKE